MELKWTLIFLFVLQQEITVICHADQITFFSSLFNLVGQVILLTSTRLAVRVKTQRTHIQAEGNTEGL